MRPWSIIFFRARPRATQPAVTEAARVPPSAWMTSQSMMICRSPSARRSVTARRERPMSRWISWVRPEIRPATRSRGVRSSVARGQHGVLGGDPAPARALEERRHALVDRGRRQDARPAHLDEGRAVGEIEVVDADLHGPELVRRALAGSDGIHYLIQMAGVWSFFAWVRKSSRSFLALAESASALRSLS